MLLSCIAERGSTGTNWRCTSFNTPTMAVTLSFGAQSTFSGTATTNQQRTQSSPFQRLSSGLRINRLSDAPITRLISETLSKSADGRPNSPKTDLSTLREQLRRNRQFQALRGSMDELSNLQPSSLSSDDGATFTISDELRASSRTATQSKRNVDDGAALLTTAERAVGELSRITTELKNLAEQATSSSLLRSQRQALDNEAKALQADYLRVIQTTEVRGNTILTSEFDEVQLQAGGGAGDTITGSLGGIVGNGSIESRVAFSSGMRPYGVVAGDFNGDGALDIATADSTSSTASIFLGDGTGSFGARTSYSTGIGSGPRSITAGDFNNDGVLDLATANYGSNSVGVLFGDGSGGFGTATTLAAKGRPLSVTTGDFNGDGLLDLAAADSTENQLAVYLNVGGGTFSTRSDYGTGANPISVVSGDFNNDGAIDLVSSLGFLGTKILLGDGTGSFDAATTITSASSYAVTASDFNSDGALDLAITLPSGSNNIEVRLGDGTGGFGSGSVFTGGNRPYSLTSGDFNGDGIPDLATADAFGNSTSILIGDGTGSFGAKTSFASGSRPYSVASGDINRDGVLDLITADYVSSTASVFLGSTERGTAPLLNFSLTTVTDAKQALNQFTQKLDQLAIQAGTINSFQSRLTSASQLLQGRGESLSAAQVRIRDVENAQDITQATRLAVVKRATSALKAQGILQEDIALRLLA